MQRAMLTRSKGEGAVQTAIENELGLASAPVTIERRERMDASNQKKRDTQKTDEYKRKRANKKEKRKTTTKAKDKNHNGQNHKKQDSGKGKKTKCTVCLRVTCPRTKANPCEYKKEYSKPKCPFPTRVMEEGMRVAFVDMEFHSKIIRRRSMATKSERSRNSAPWLRRTTAAQRDGLSTSRSFKSRSR